MPSFCALSEDELKFTRSGNNPLIQDKLTGNVFFDGDQSFTETLAALLISRKVFPPVEIVAHRTADYRIDANYPEIFVKEHDPDIHNHLYILKIRLSGSESTLEKYRAPSGYEELIDVGLFLKQKNVDAKVFINRTTQGVCLIVRSGITPTELHIIESFIPRMFPWIFEDQPLSNTELQLLMSAESGMEEYLSVLTTLYLQSGIEEKRAQVLLGNLKKRITRQKYVALERDIENDREEMRRIIDSYRYVCEKIEVKQNKLFSLKWRLDNTEDDNTLAQFFTNNPNLELLSVNDDGAVTFRVKTTLINYNPDMFDPKNDFFYEIYSVDNPFWQNRIKRRKFMEQLFSPEPVISVRMMAEFIMDLTGYISTRECKGVNNNFIPNAHIEYYGCLGDNEMLINERIQAGDFVGAIIQCLGSTGSQNLLEEATVKHFLQDLFNSEGKVIECDGKEMTTKEAYIWLQEKGVIDKDE